MSWQEFGETDESDDETPAITLGDLRDGETVCLEVTGEPETFESNDYGEGVRTPAEFITSDYTFRTDDDGEVEEGDAVVLVTWSKRLVAALARFEERNEGVVGETVMIEKRGSGYETDYKVHEA